MILNHTDKYLQTLSCKFYIIDRAEQSFTHCTKDDAAALVELSILREKLGIIEVERKREREQFEERVEHLQDTLNKSQDNQNKTTLLLEHYTKGGRGDEWSQSLKSLEERITNQKKSDKEEKGKLKAQLEDKEKELEAEKRKGFFKRFFG